MTHNNVEQFDAAVLEEDLRAGDVVRELTLDICGVSGGTERAPYSIAQATYLADVLLGLSDTPRNTPHDRQTVLAGKRWVELREAYLLDKTGLDDPAEDTTLSKREIAELKKEHLQAHDAFYSADATYIETFAQLYAERQRRKIDGQATPELRELEDDFASTALRHTLKHAMDSARVRIINGHAHLETEPPISDDRYYIIRQIVSDDGIENYTVHEYLIDYERDNRLYGTYMLTESDNKTVVEGARLISQDPATIMPVAMTGLRKLDLASTIRRQVPDQFTHASNELAA